MYKRAGIISSGTLTVNNVAVNRLNKEELRQFRKNIGMIFQQPSILERKTVYENIAFPMKCWGVPEAERRAKAEELIHLVELDEKRDVKAKNLSGGQKQRVAIARALTLNRPSCCAMKRRRHWIRIRPRIF